MRKIFEDFTYKAVDFYKDKEPKPKYTTEFVKHYRQKSGGYIDFAKVFEDNTEREENDKWNIMCKNHKEIENLAGQEKLDELHSLKGLGKDFIFNVGIDKEKGEPNQKWHFLVSYCAQKEIGHKRKLKNSIANIKDENITSPELWLWLFETAKDGVVITDEDIELVYESAIAYRNGTGRYAGQTNKRAEWILFLEDYKCKLEKIIDSN